MSEVQICVYPASGNSLHWQRNPLTRWNTYQKSIHRAEYPDDYTVFRKKFVDFKSMRPFDILFVKHELSGKMEVEYWYISTTATCIAYILAKYERWYDI